MTASTGTSVLCKKLEVRGSTKIFKSDSPGFEMITGWIIRGLEAFGLMSYCQHGTPTKAVDLKTEPKSEMDNPKR